MSGAVVGLLLAIATMVVTRAGRPWFGISLSVVIGVMMVSYVAVPARLISVTPTSSRRDALTASAVGVLSFATALQAGATGAVKSVQMSAKLLAPRPAPPGDAVAPDDPPPAADAHASPGQARGAYLPGAD